MLEIPKFEDKKELFKFLVDNKETLSNQKKSAIKYADGISSNVTLLKDFTTVKSTNKANDNEDEITVKAIINTTNIMDSHDDVHIKGLWNKSIKENKRILHVQEHKSQEFDKIISSGKDLNVSVADFKWKELGFNANGSTEALVFDSTVKRSRNKYMFNQYKSGFVDNHSVGMQYVKLDLAINDEEFEENKVIFDKHIDSIVNKEDATNQGYFWVVTEAKAIEGSAVPLGSNPITPTLENKTEPSNDTQTDKEEAASKALQEKKQLFL